METVFVTFQGSPHTRLERALKTGNALSVRAVAAELPRVGIDDALQGCVVLARAEPERYEPAAIRWLGRLLLEDPNLTLADAQPAAAALTALPRSRHDIPALVAFAAFCQARGLPRAARTLGQLIERHTP